MGDSGHQQLPHIPQPTVAKMVADDWPMQEIPRFDIGQQCDSPGDSIAPTFQAGCAALAAVWQ